MALLDKGLSVAATCHSLFPIAAFGGKVNRVRISDGHPIYHIISTTLIPRVNLALGPQYSVYGRQVGIIHYPNRHN